MKYAVVNPQNQVVNVILWDGQSPWRPPLGHHAIACPEYTGIGHIYNNLTGEFVAPEIKKG